MRKRAFTVLIAGMLANQAWTDTIPYTCISGGYAFSTGTNVALHSIVGQTAVGTTSAESMELTAGFLAIPDVKRFLLNDPPMVTSKDSAAVTKGRTLVYKATGFDEDGPSLALSFTALPAWLESIGSDVVTGTAPDQAGTAAFKVIASDGSRFDTLTVTVVIKETNNKPSIASAAADTAAEGDLFQYVLTATDPDKDPLTLTVTNLPSWLAFNDSTGLISGTVPENAPSVTITLNATDGEFVAQQQLKLTVLKVNNRPRIVSARSASATEDRRFVYVVQTQDPENDQLAIAFDPFTLPEWIGVFGDSLIGTPQNGDAGGDIVVMAAELNTEEELADTITLALSVIAVNDPPLITSLPGISGVRVPPGQRVTYHPSATDEEGADVAFEFISVPQWMAVEGDSVTGIVGSSVPNNDTLVFRAVEQTADSLADTMTVAITIVEKNFPPVIASDTLVYVFPGRDFLYIGTATDPNHTVPTVTFANLPPSWSLYVHGDSVSGRVPISFRDQTFFTIRATDGLLTVLKQVTIRASQENTVPRLDSIPGQYTRLGQAFKYTVIARDEDVLYGADQLRFSLLEGPAGMTVTGKDSLTAQIDWTPETDQADTFDATVRVQDSHNGADTMAFSIICRAAFLELVSSTPANAGIVAPMWSGTLSAVFSDTLADSLDLDSGVITVSTDLGDTLGHGVAHAGRRVTLTLDSLPQAGSFVTVTMTNAIMSKYGETFVSPAVSWSFETALLGDFDADGEIDEADLVLLADNWHAARDDDGRNDDSICELGPVSGILPSLRLAPDGQFDYRDIAVFVQMWRYMNGSSGKRLAACAPPQDARRIHTSRTELAAAADGTTGCRILLGVKELPGAAAVRYQIAYPASRLALGAAELRMLDAGEKLAIVGDETAGFVDMAGVSLDRGKRELSGSGVMASVTFSGTPKPGDRVTVGYRYLDKKGNTVEQGWEEIELAPAGAADAPARASFAVAPNPVSAAGSRRACTLRHDASALRSVAASGAGGVFVVTVPAASADGRAPVSLAVFSAAGARVLSCGADALRDVAAVQDASYLLHIYWDGRDQAGNLLEPGVYTAVVQVGGGAGAFRMKASVGIVR